MSGDVKFIRVNGRVVPVKNKGSVVSKNGKAVSKANERRKTIVQSEKTGMKMGASVGGAIGASLGAAVGKRVGFAAKLGALGATAGASFGLVAGNIAGKYKASKLKPLKKYKSKKEA